MVNSTRKGRAEKPAKPYPDFPLFPHATRRWAKKIRGKLHYFGPWDDPDGALRKYLDQRDYLHAGRTPQPAAEGPTIRDLCNRFLTSKRVLVDSGELAPRTWRDYHTCCTRIIAVFGKERSVTDLASADFERLRTVMSQTMGPTSLKVEIQRTRSVFRYAYEASLIDRPVRYGPLFKPRAKRVLDKERHRNGPKMFEAEELKAMIAAAPMPFKAMVYLGINCGFGNNDCATLPLSALDLEAGWVDHPRPKTGAERRIPLWPETVVVLREAIAARYEPKDPNDAQLVFVTRHGNPWVRFRGSSWSDTVTIMCGELLSKLGLKRLGRNFYALRHTFETIGGESIDQVAVDHIMGHSRGDMASVYRERISDERLQAVVEHVHGWLFGATGAK